MAQTLEADEWVHYESGEYLVTNKKVLTPAGTFPVANIEAVLDKRQLRGIPLLLFGGGGLILFIGLFLGLIASFMAEMEHRSQWETFWGTAWPWLIPGGFLYWLGGHILTQDETKLWLRIKGPSETKFEVCVYANYLPFYKSAHQRKEREHCRCLMRALSLAVPANPQSEEPEQSAADSTTQIVAIHSVKKGYEEKDATSQRTGILLSCGAALAIAVVVNTLVETYFKKTYGGLLGSLKDGYSLWKNMTRLTQIGEQILLVVFVVVVLWWVIQAIKIRYGVSK